MAKFITRCFYCGKDQAENNRFSFRDLVTADPMKPCPECLDKMAAGVPIHDPSNNRTWWLNSDTLEHIKIVR